MSIRRLAPFALATASCGITVSLLLSAELPRHVLNPKTFNRLGTVDQRFASYNIEMLELTGGRFWKPYKDIDAMPHLPGSGHAAASAAGMDPNLFQYRPPIDLTNGRLRKLAAALGPAYVRFSGTWANTTYFQDSDEPAPKTPPQGFNGVLTRKQWKNAVTFSQAVHAQIITSFAISPGTRDAQGLWQPDQARLFLSATKSMGGTVAAVEFMNEPNIPAIGGAPKGYTAAAYARDVARFRPFLQGAAPGVLFLGPGSVAEGGSTPLPANMGFLSSESLLEATGPVFDALSYHLYSGVSRRCAATSGALQTSADQALSADWITRSGETNRFYAKLRDRFEPGKPLWLTETADAACGGNPWASTFLDTFRYLDEHGRAAQQGVQVIAHNTLAASDYGLLDENTFAPRPNYWAAVLWNKLMGETVLQPGPSTLPNLYVYAHCLKGTKGGVALLAINADKTTAPTLTLPVAAQRYTVTAKALESSAVDLNGTPLQLEAGDNLPRLAPVTTAAGPVTVPPASITFLAIPNAGNAACQ